MRPARLLAVLVVLGTVLAMPAAAKRGVRAKLDHPIQLNAPAGKTVRVAWHLIDENGRPFGASGIYLRVSRCGRKPLRVAAATRRHGHYVARVRMPKGGIRKLLVGLEGWRITRSGRRTRADVFFQFNPPLHHDCPADRG
jgi:hypothetical protein